VLTWREALTMRRLGPPGLARVPASRRLTPDAVARRCSSQIREFEKSPFLITEPAPRAIRAEQIDPTPKSALRLGFSGRFMSMTTFPM